MLARLSAGIAFMGAHAKARVPLVVTRCGSCRLPPRNRVCAERFAMRRLSYGLPLVLLFSATGCASGPLGRLERSMLYQPSPAQVGDWADVNKRGFQEVDFESHDHTKLHEWFYDHPEQRAVVLFLHGNGGNVATWAEPVRELAVQHRLSGFHRNPGSRRISSPFFNFLHPALETEGSGSGHSVRPGREAVRSCGVQG
mgnify:CR=1 FL=1